MILWRGISADSLSGRVNRNISYPADRAKNTPLDKAIIDLRSTNTYAIVYMLSRKPKSDRSVFWTCGPDYRNPIGTTQAQPSFGYRTYKPDTILIRLGHCLQEKKIKRKICPDSYRSEARKRRPDDPSVRHFSPDALFPPGPKPHQWREERARRKKIDFLRIGPPPPTPCQFRSHPGLYMGAHQSLSSGWTIHCGGWHPFGDGKVSTSQRR
ncbi:uncharacterized protein NPIL_140521 [Nephila pilipes]|uniref:Uncharacterized protein n=1 Tax=Nephila pilipes TaxID=299642 RepID=A0A8X6MZY0_NEPPI|nr:uncharacterized protein NPIL_140521 [Nephila pilipes]